MLSSTECHLQFEAQRQVPYFFSVVCSAAADHNVCSLTAEGLVVIGGCQDAASVSGEMRPHAHYNSQRCPLPLRELQARARHVNESPGDGPDQALHDQRTAPDPLETGAISAIVADPLFKDAALVVLASPLHRPTQKSFVLAEICSHEVPRSASGNHCSSCALPDGVVPGGGLPAPLRGDVQEQGPVGSAGPLGPQLHGPGVPVRPLRHRPVQWLGQELAVPAESALRVRGRDGPGPPGTR